MIFDAASKPAARALTLADLEAVRDRVSMPTQPVYCVSPGEYRRRMAATRPASRPTATHDTVVVPGLGRGLLLRPDRVG